MKNNVSKSKITHLEKEKRSLSYFHKILSSELSARIQEMDFRFTIDHLLKTLLKCVLLLPERSAKCSDSPGRTRNDSERNTLSICKIMMHLTPWVCNCLTF